MLITLLKSKIHRATVTQTEPDYPGSVTIDGNLMLAAGIVEYEKVLVVDVNNGQRLETYCIAGPAGSGVICLNGAAARLVNEGDLVIVMSFCALDPAEARAHKPIVVYLTADNAVSAVKSFETHGAPSP
ncbi:MAG: aspartate 1-decarboxylase [Deltaproteobacteria bacterium]|jgi:aspartate 1-decarboxylase|nr:aspartate 1-decarboxylase [Deltaproteobacteria bacterium]